MAPRRIRIDISAAAILKVLVAAAAVWVWLRLWQWVLLLLVAVFLAVALDPIVQRLERWRIRRSYGAPLVVFTLATLLGGFVYLSGAQLAAEARLLGGRLDEFRQDVMRRMPRPVMDALPAQGGQGSGQSGGQEEPRQAEGQGGDRQKQGAARTSGGSQAGASRTNTQGQQAGGQGQAQGSGGTGQFTTYVAQIGRALVNGLLSIGVAFILTLYLLLDGRRTYEWCVAFSPRAYRERVRRTAMDGRTAIQAYVRGNVIMSAVAAAISYVFFAALDVPAALLLALLSGILDFVPVLGFILSAIPAVLLALAVSPAVCIAVAAFMIVYNAVENYYIAPKVYGRELRLSDLAVVLAFAAGAELAGVVGALIALPIAAMYPTIENIWLSRWLGRDVAADHRAIERSAEH